MERRKRVSSSFILSSLSQLYTPTTDSAGQRGVPLSHSQYYELLEQLLMNLIRLSQILGTSDSIDQDTLTLSNQPRGGENLVSSISGDLKSLGIK